MKLTILMYHKIDALPPDARYPGNYVRPDRFEQQMDALLAWGYHSIGIADWLGYRDGARTAVPERPLIVTFDDGYRCFARNAWPVLRARGMGALMFVVTSRIGGTNAWDAAERQERLLDADEMRALREDGVEFGSHSATHPALARIPTARARDEIMRSREQLAALLGRPPEVFAYPYSNQNRAVRRLVGEAGFRAGVRGGGRMNGRRTDPFGLRRIKVEPEWTVDDLRRTLAAARMRIL